MQDKLNKYLQLLEKAPLNLISSNSNPFYHLLDSLAPFEKQDFFKKGDVVLDVGSGGGFPLIPLSISYPEVQFWGMESRLRKANFLNDCKRELNISNIQIITERAEILGKNTAWREKFTYVISRAFAPLRIYLEVAAPFVQVGGKILTYKTPEQTEVELLAIQEFLPQIKCVLHQVVPYFFVYQKQKYSFNFLVFSKQDKTPLSFPHSWKKLKTVSGKKLDS
jgi:16S rRNA (guanine527-N7)-methyltransferase